MTKFIFKIATTIILSTLLLTTTGNTSKRQSTKPEPAADRAAIHQALVDLTNSFTVMCVAAHPDDEDGTTLTVLRRKYGVHTVSLFSTYGEGGQNAVGPELNEELGVIRARETMAAAAIQGSEAYFLGMTDFGFSKSADEAFKVWGHDEPLRRMVLKIRELRPDVIITNHDTTSGHGHHQATGRLILEAFDAAADPNRFPEQLKTVAVWQPQRLFVRGFGRRDANPPTEGKFVSVDPNERDPVRNSIYAEQALLALQQHATQGPWPKSIAERLRNSENGKLPLIRYHLEREAKGAASLSANPQSVLDGLQLPEDLASRLAPPTIENKPLPDVLDQPDAVIDVLLALRKSGRFQTSNAAESQRFRLMEKRLDTAIAVLNGVSLSISSRPAELVPGVPESFGLNLSNGGTRPLRIERVVFTADKEININAPESLPAGTDTTLKVEDRVPANAPISVPAEDHLYDGRLFGQTVSINATVTIDGVSFTVPATGKVDVTPAVEIKKVSPVPFVVTPQIIDKPVNFSVTVVNHLSTPFSGSLAATSEKPRSIAIADLNALKPHEASQVILKFDATPLGPTRPVRTPLSRLHEVSFAVRQTGSGNAVTEESVPVVHADARAPHGLRVGYLPSFDETLAHALEALGVDSKELTVEDVKKGDLATFDTIIIDNRGYEAHPELIAVNDRLLQFVKEGGTLLVFYHKTNEWNPDTRRNRPQLAPYPIVLSDDRVTDENAPIRFLQQLHPLLTTPNRITQNDFAGWVQERGLYYPKQWDSHYTALFATNDPNEPPLNGGLLTARYGEGNYIYTSMVWYRQLRAGVPGGYRMFANLVSYGYRGRPRTPMASKGTQ